MENSIYRLHYRGQLKEGIKRKQLQKALASCEENIRRAQKDGVVLTAALYYHGDMLFLYYEAVGPVVQTPEPAESGHNIASGDTIATGPQTEAAKPMNVIPCGGDKLMESGEDIQAFVIKPDQLLEPLRGFMQTWPGQAGERLWVHMYHIYYHCIPESIKHWERPGIPNLRRGRIAFLREDKLFSYVYYHKAIVDEGLLLGDKYQSIALHENVLFSYFEEPRVQANVKGDFETPSKVIDQWMAVDPEAHFIHMPQGNGGNFMFLPAYFAMGKEDLGKE